MDYGNQMLVNFCCTQVTFPPLHTCNHLRYSVTCHFFFNMESLNKMPWKEMANIFLLSDFERRFGNEASDVRSAEWGGPGCDTTTQQRESINENWEWSGRTNTELGQFGSETWGLF